ncbi:tetratricopeptide repeat protein [Orrella sp. 11846]|uniref:tetratricopeptide repeat protein n=1 Tax=Orrella sp. 11846 TaxID=3409913 RepID=UPI003B5BAFCD
MDKITLKQLFENKNYKEIVQSHQSLLANYPDDYRVFEQLAKSYINLDDHQRACQVYQKAVQLASPKILNFREIEVSLNHLNKTSEEKKDFWLNCSSNNEILLEKCCNKVLQNDIKSAQQILLSARDQLNLSEHQFATLYNNLTMFSQGETYNAEMETSLEKLSLPKVVNVSGMGWSGSGAVFDYLREFKDVIPIRGETPYLSRGRYNLTKILSNINSKEKFRENLILFYFYTIIGFLRPKNWSDFKSFNNTRKRLYGKEADTYITWSSRYCYVANKLLQNYRKKGFLHLLNTLKSIVILGFICDQPYRKGMTLLLDNDVSIGSVNEHLDFVVQLCTFRDPRSNYVALKREDRMYRQSVDDYLISREKSYKRNLTKLKNLIKLPSMSSLINIVQFEEFVVSEKYRDSIATLLNFDVNNRTRHRYFKPWESFRNTQLHQEYENQDEISLIENHLKEYCYDVAVVRASRESVGKAGLKYTQTEETSQPIALIKEMDGARVFSVLRDIKNKLNENNNILRQKEIHLERTNAELTLQTHALEKQLSTLSHEVTKLGESNAALRQREANFQRKNEQLANRNAELRFHMDKILNSVSWRITKPLRWLP